MNIIWLIIDKIRVNNKNFYCTYFRPARSNVIIELDQQGQPSIILAKGHKYPYDLICLGVKIRKTYKSINFCEMEIE